MDDLTKCFCMAKTAPPKFELPSLVYIRTLSEETGKPFNSLREKALETLEKDYKPKVQEIKGKDFNQSDVYYGMYNAVIDLDRMIDIQPILDRVILDDFGDETISGVKFSLLKVVGRRGKFVDLFELTSEYGFKKKSDGSPNSLDFTIRMNDSQGASVTIFSSGRIRFSGGYLQTNKDEPRLLLNFMKKFLEIPNNVKINFNNVTCEYKMSMKPDLKNIFTLFDKAITKGLAKYDDVEVESEFAPERGVAIQRKAPKKQTPFLYIKFKNRFTLILSNSNIIQLEGNTNIIKDVPFVKKFMEGLKNGLMLTGKPDSPVSSPITPKATKIKKRADNLPAPEVTRRGATCPPGRRPRPYSFQGVCPSDKFYVRPNPQGQPCCYKIPKSITYSRAKVAVAYKKAGVKVPESVRKVFGIGLDTENLPENVSKGPVNLYTHINKDVGFKIGTRQCSRYTKVGLMDIAKRMDIPDIPKFISKPNLCELIRKRAQAIGLNRTKNFEKGPLLIDGRIKFGRRFCDSYEKPDIVRIGTKAGVSGLTLEMTKKQLCDMIKEQTQKDRRKELRVTREQMKENLNVLFGNRKATNENVQALLNFIRNKNINASPRVIERLKKEFVNYRK